jgi:N-acetyl-beta-hexosaminidase
VPSVIPEVDLPGHANGLLPLKQSGATFCADSQLYADKAGKTNEVLIALLKEYAQLFGSQTFHLGCDETSIKLPLCTLAATTAVEVAVSEAVHGFQNDGANMWPMGWEEFHWRTNASSSVGPGSTGAIIEAWSKYKAADVVKAGYRAVEADGGKFYLNHLHPVSSQWHDIGAGIETAAEKALMLGGEICM